MCNSVVNYIISFIRGRLTCSGHCPQPYSYNFSGWDNVWPIVDDSWSKYVLGTADVKDEPIDIHTTSRSRWPTESSPVEVVSISGLNPTAVPESCG